VNTTFPGIPLIDDGIRLGLTNSRYQLEIYREYMDTVYFPDPADQQRIRDVIVHKYQNHRPDVIITVGPSPIRFMVEKHELAFPGVPIVFCLPQFGPATLALGPDFTGVENELAPRETVDAAVHLQPHTKHVVVVGGMSATDKQIEGVVRDQLEPYEGGLDISYLTTETMPNLLERLKDLPPGTIVLYLGFGLDATGTKFVSGSEAATLIVGAANAPVFSLFDVHLNHGEVGGKVSYHHEQGRIAGGLALRVLDGEKPEKIPYAKSGNTYIFDWRGLKRWGFKESDLPPGSIVLNRQPTLWDSYKWYILGGICLLLAQTSLIVGLLWQRANRRKAEAAIRESEGRFRLVANTAPVMIWTTGTDKLCNYVNKPWLDFTGRTFEQELGSGWSEAIHGEDVVDSLRTYTEAFDKREQFELQYRLRRYDGEYRWVLDIGVPRFNQDGSFAGYIGSCLDTTERKLAEDALANVSHRLIEAQEQERTRIARELHDDINQRIALAAIELDQLEQNSTGSGLGIRRSINDVKRRVLEIGVEVQAISHRLHSSKLEYLGVVVACRSFCTEVTERQEVTVDYKSENMPAGVPQDVSLCLFRVLQESLNNAIKHSGAKYFEVQLRGTSGEIQLTVRDHGAGFDVEAAMGNHGLGLISMRERASLVKGKVLISSQPRSGTEIILRIPLAVSSTSEATSGAA
jgi:PAS domain S-box-containing protein